MTIGVSESLFRGGQHLHPAKIQSLPAKISSCQGGHVFCQAAEPSFSAKLSCQTVLLMDKLEDKWLKNRQKWEKNRKVWQKPTKSGRKLAKMTEKLSKCGVLLIIFRQ